MKEINEEELLKLENKEKAKILKQICEEKIKYLGGKNNESKRL